MRTSQTVHNTQPVFVAEQLCLFRHAGETVVHAVSLFFGVMDEGGVIVEEDTGFEYGGTNLCIITVCIQAVIFAGEQFPFGSLVEGVSQETAEEPVLGGRDETGKLSESTAGEQSHKRTVAAHCPARYG